MKKSIFMIWLYCAMLFLFPSVVAWAGEIKDEIKFSEVYIAPIAKSSNQVTHVGNQQVRAAVGGTQVSIPAGWRLISVIPKGQSSYVLFFQDQSYGVHTIGLETSGSLSGKADYIFLPATK